MSGIVFRTVRPPTEDQGPRRGDSRIAKGMGNGKDLTRDPPRHLHVVNALGTAENVG